MSSNAITAAAWSVRQIFSQPHRLTTPLMQRRYEWREEPNWRQLWEDLRGLTGSAEAHPTGFIGSIVLKMTMRAFGAEPSWPVLDGQQRLVTLLMVIEALRRRALADGREALASELDALRRAGAGDGYTLAPSRADAAAFSRAMAITDAELAVTLAEAEARRREAETARRPGEKPPDALEIEPLLEALGYFRRRIDDHLDAAPNPATALDRLTTALLDGLQAVVVCVNAERLDPYAVFETLNARGRPLSNLDLTKNYLFSACLAEGVRPGELETIERDVWRVFHRDDLAHYWSREISRGSQRGPVIDWFLRAYLQSHPLPETLARDATLSRAYAGLRKMHESGGRSARALIDDLCRGAQAWLWIEDKEPPPRHAEALRELKLFGRSAVDSFLLACILTRWDEPGDKLDQAFRWVRSYLARRYVSRKLEAPVEPLIRAAHLARTEADYPTRIAEDLARREGAMVWPDEAMFRDAWATQPIYKPKDSAAVAAAKAILGDLEQALRDDKWEAITTPEALTVEHILPQSWRKRRWPTPELGPEERRALEERRDQLINTVGNLTLATFELNQALDNNPWTQKRGRLKESGSALNRRLLDDPRWRDRWDAPQIEERSATLFEVARALYPHPAS